MLFRFGSLNGMPFEATDGEIGRIKDALFDDQLWTLRYLLVEVETCLAGRKVLIPPSALKMIDWRRNVVQVDLTRQQVKESPTIDTGTRATDPPLRSTREVCDYRLQTSDDLTVHVEDFLFDTASWAIRYLVVDTRDQLPGKHVVIPPQWITNVDWNERLVKVDVTRRTLAAAPEYQSSNEYSTAHEICLQRHYEREGYPQ